MTKMHRGKKAAASLSYVSSLSFFIYNINPTAVTTSLQKNNVHFTGLLSYIFTNINGLSGNII